MFVPHALPQLSLSLSVLLFRQMAGRPLRILVRKVYHPLSVDRRNGRMWLEPDHALLMATVSGGLVCVGDELSIAPLGTL